jgi:hypothetical protein
MESGVRRRAADAHVRLFALGLLLVVLMVADFGAVAMILMWMILGEHYGQRFLGREKS